MAKKLRIDWLMFAVAAGLAMFGVIMVYSASAMIALKETANAAEGASQYGYVLKQAGFTALGLIGMYAMTKVHYRWLKNQWFVYGLIGVTVLFLMAVFAFPAINGARRWIRVPGFSFQPSELAKLTVTIFLAYFYTKNEKYIGDLKQTVLPSALVLALLSGLVFIEPDLGTVIVMSAIFTVVYFSSGARLMHLGVVIGGLLVMGIGALIFAPWRMARLVAFMDPWDKADSTGYQVVQSLLAIGSGGIAGEGFANGQQKLFYLPYPYSDFIFAVVGEELGLIGTLAVLIAFGVLLWRGARAALLAPDRFGKLLGIGLITGLVVQAFFNMSVVLSLMPAKGIPLPFISYGGTSILFTLFSVGILLNLSQYAGFVELRKEEEEPKKIRKRKVSLR